MLLKLKVTPSKENAGKQIERLAAKLSDAQKLNAAVGRGFERTLRRHFRELDKRPNRRGWRKSHFWEKIAADTVFAGADDSRAVVSIGSDSGPKFAAKVFGARIRPKSGKKFLAIPAIEARYGVSPSSLDKNELQFRRTRKGGLLGRLMFQDCQHFRINKTKTRTGQARALKKFLVRARLFAVAHHIVKVGKQGVGIIWPRGGLRVVLYAKYGQVFQPKALNGVVV